MKKHNLYALVAAGLLASGMSVSSASAADLGGNCCADLEERIAELEATTARKGNRKVSLTVSGWVGQQVTFWDDGFESNTYVHDLGGTLGSHVKFTGSAQISPGWSAGYVLHLEAIGADGLTMNQNALNNGSAFGNTGESVYALQSFWFVKSDQLGKLSVGKQSQASDNTAILVDGSGSLVPANWVAFDVNNFQIRNAATGAFVGNWGGIGGCRGGGAWGDCNGGTQNVVRYDSPTFGGFSVSASWGEDDMWDVAARYAGEFSGFKLAAAAAYNELSDENFGVVAGDTFQYFQAGAFLMHVPTGLFAYGAYGDAQYQTTAGGSETWYGKVGLRTRFSALGHTVFYGEYEQVDATGAAFSTSFAGTCATGFAPAGGNCTDGTAPVDPVAAAASNELELWGAGIVQEVDAAAMSVWVKYRHLEATIPGTPTDDFQYVGVGGLINF